jgi:hypothetical protein
MSRTPHRVLRVLVALLGGYGFAHGFAALATAALARAGLPFEDAWQLAAILVFPLLLTVVIWTFGSRRITRVAMVLVGGAVVMTASAHALARLGTGPV